MYAKSGYGHSCDHVTAETHIYKNYPLILHPILIIRRLQRNYPQIIRNYPTPNFPSDKGCPYSSVAFGQLSVALRTIVRRLRTIVYASSENEECARRRKETLATEGTQEEWRMLKSLSMRLKRLSMPLKSLSMPLKIYKDCGGDWDVLLKGVIGC